MLPFHRREARREPTARAEKPPRNGQSKWSQLVHFVIYFIKVSWRDILTMAILGAASLAIYQAPYAATRNFPVTFDASGDIVYPQFAYPERGWIISPSLSGVISAVIPLGIILLAQVRIRSFWDFNNAVLGLLYSLILGSLFQVIIKQLIGGFRPYFLAVCQPDISLAPTHNNTGLNGVGFHQIMYTSEVCTNPDKQAIKTAMTSFPSGHSTTAFAGYVFLFLWMNAKLKVWANFQASFYWLAVLLAPLLGATLMAACLTVDQAHNWYDILAGVVIGTVVAFMSYRLCYAAVWDWRYNHIPLRRDRVFDYTAAAALPAEVLEKALWVRKLGWGRKRRAGRRGMMGKAKARGSSNASSATYARNGGPSMDVPRGQGVSYPHPATVRHNGGDPYYGRGENMV
ncbi:acid phosphatase/Vanadium-dependent haloperoxidase [Parathielavia appendiculata]|uniref:Acid phosphatase/Vanadium-dependent haloperoxidase n=1 Tax=Parathielavia appendiculata TaxID=2587402 RepID=A0AAN6YZD3_9PEZI|nr:acid phosphatase/Vanadium-dependent haloperoxidase [Parathielavia appendiculata]